MLRRAKSRKVRMAARLPGGTAFRLCTRAPAQACATKCAAPGYKSPSQSEPTSDLRWPEKISMSHAAPLETTITPAKQAPGLRSTSLKFGIPNQHYKRLFQSPFAIPDRPLPPARLARRDQRMHFPRDINSPNASLYY